ncbi:transcriptional regulator, LacI family [Cognatiyoonia koreensis]|uniref:Transcriptional regulator, LacI family n=1 Tax=Cognatiyoonia koreensis TaxID=364200 RepID=A0A1I0QPM7_9RHOB|nr:substrate-binding domain-containing protein [Cognatiyoonia koreensis]SEW29426.1 transcriptional regulator, LacI family [Cognatiyoonia koreensis]
MATLKDISTELGLSVATVSRALNGFPEVNIKTRDKVQKAANRLGYKPNRVAQRLVTGRSGMVGMIVKIKPDMSADQTFFETLTGLTAALSARETDLVLAVDQTADPVEPYKKLLERDILDGFILNAPVVNDPRVDFLKSRGIPFVLHGQDRADADYPYFGIDNQAVPAVAVDMLAALGHQRIAMINGELRHAYAADRLTGYRDAMARHRFAPIVENGATFESHGYTMALAMLAGVEKPTAFICASTVIAEGVMQAVRDRGLQVPQDVSVIAHDDALPLTRAVSFDPALTVTRAPLRDACEPLAGLLLDHLNGADVADCQVLNKAELIVRGSTGPAPTEE